MAERQEIRHATYAGVQQHKRRGEKVCDDCLKAQAVYMREYRADPRNRRRDRESQDARDAALKELSHLHGDEYRALYTRFLGEIRGVA